MALALFSYVILAVLISLNSMISGSAEGKESGSNRVFGTVICLGVPGLMLALIWSFLVKDLRKWSATKTSKLMIFERGFTYESEGRTEACHWDEIKDITYRRVEVRSKHAAPRRVNLVRSIVKSDGELISLAETLNLTRITKLITAARK